MIRADVRRTGMIRLLARAVAVASVSILLLTQSMPQRTSASNAHQHRPSIPGGLRSMKGCLVKDDEKGFVLVSQRGSRVSLTSAEDLSHHIGQQVKASGAFVEKEPSEPDPSSEPERKLHPEHDFRVIKIDVVSQSCAAGTKK